MNPLTLILIIASVQLTKLDAVDVMMKGKLNLGKDVVDKITHYLHKNVLDGRRAFDNTDNENAADDQHDSYQLTQAGDDTITLIVNSASLCRDFDFCNGRIRSIINDCIISLTKSVEGIFYDLVGDLNENEENGTRPLLFEEDLRRLILDLRKMLRNANEKITDENESYVWLDLIKRMNAKFQERASMFAWQRLEGSVQEIIEVKKKLTQKLVIAGSTVELEFERKLCTDFGVCSDSYKCSYALNEVLSKLVNLTDDRAKDFIKYFNEVLPTTNFNYKLSDVTVHEFKSVLHDMAFAANIPTKTVLFIVQNSIAERLNAVASKFTERYTNPGKDVRLAHVILSDMDHFYSKQKKNPFEEYLKEFIEWSHEGGSYSAPLLHVMKDIQNVLGSKSDELVMKLVNEVRVFMEITVDPEP